MFRLSLLSLLVLTMALSSCDNRRNRRPQPTNLNAVSSPYQLTPEEEAVGRLFGMACNPNTTERDMERFCNDLAADPYWAEVRQRRAYEQERAEEMQRQQQYQDNMQCNMRLINANIQEQNRRMGAGWWY